MMKKQKGSLRFHAQTSTQNKRNHSKITKQKTSKDLGREGNKIMPATLLKKVAPDKLAKTPRLKTKQKGKMNALLPPGVQPAFQDTSVAKLYEKLGIHPKDRPSIAAAKYSSTGIARYIVKYCLSHEEHINSIKMQQLLYLVYGFYLIQYNKCLFPEMFEAWTYGPVNRKAYIEFYPFAGSNLSLFGDSQRIADLTKSDKQFVDNVLSKYVHANTLSLVEASKSKGFAWQKTMAENPTGIRSKIAMDDIRSEFDERAKSGTRVFSPD